MFISAKVFFDDNLDKNITLVKETMNLYPEVYKQKFLANARVLTPVDTAQLRRSIITQVSGRSVKVGWRAPYARAVNEGRHTVPRPVRGINPKTGLYSTIAPGVYTHRTGAKGFAERTVDATKEDMKKYIKERLG